MTPVLFLSTSMTLWFGPLGQSEFQCPALSPTLGLSVAQGA